MRAELDVEGSEFVGAKEGERDGVAGTLVCDARGEKGGRGAEAVNGYDLVSGVDALFVCGRALDDRPYDERARRGGSADDRLAVTRKRRAEVDFFRRGPARWW